MKLFNKVNLSRIIVDHFKTLVNSNTNKAGFDDYFTFLIFPLITGVGLLLFKQIIDKDIVNIIITILSIFVGLLINVIVLIFDIIKRDAEKNLKNVVLRQTISNITYTILISIITIIFCLFTFVNYNIIKIVSSGFIYFLAIHFFVTLFMILKRMYLLFIGEIDE